MTSIRKALAVGVASAAFASACAFACGPFFPWQMLDNRTATLRDLPVDSFFFQATHLLPRPDPVLHDQAPADPRAVTPAPAACSVLRDPAEAGTSAAAALAARYVEGAAAFGRNDDAAAAALFRAALSAGSGAGTMHSVCAAFMLGRSLARSGDAAGARSAFLRTRDLASHGAPDTLGLAVASFGEQARLALRDSGLVVAEAPASEPVAPTPERLAALHLAVTLYSQQAAYGAQSGVDSLQEVAQALFADQPGAEAWFAAAAADPRIRQLLVSYALADTPAIEGAEEGEFVSNPLLGSLDSAPVTARLLDRLAPVFDPGTDPRDAGRLAAVAYIAGRYDLAALFAAAPADPLSAWVRAKLSLQHGDLAASAQAFDAAVRTAASHPGVLGETGIRLRAEPAVVAVGQGDFERALRLLYGFGPGQAPTGAYVTDEEKRRYVVFAPQPDKRFHYRFQAAAEAERAASLLPPRSQANAAMLCAGAHWLSDTGDTAGAGRLYRLYIANGAMLPKGMVFGASCAAPDFDAAVRLRWTLPLWRVGWSVSHHWHGLQRRLGL